jgi:pilus assembly protein CpaB
VNTRRTTLLIAIILAIGTGWLTLNYISSLRSNEGGQPRQVVIATSDIPARGRITAAMVHTETRSASQPDAIADPAAAIGSLALVSIPAGSQIAASEIASNANESLPVRLQPGMRAVSIAIDRVKGVSGLIQPGDRVDVIAIPPKGNDEPPKAATILRGIRVLAIGNSLESASATPSPDEQNAATVTLEVNPKQADLLEWADSNSTVRLALRSPREPIRSQQTEQLTFGSSGVPLSLPPPAPVPPVPSLTMPAPAPPVRTASGVQVIDGDQVVLSTGSNTP